METFQPTILLGKHIRLEPLRQEHHDALARAANDEKIWRFTSLLGHGPHFENWWNIALRDFQKGERVPYTVLDQKSGDVIGSSSYLHLALADRCLEIGHTWYSPARWASWVNPECKLLLMTQALEVMGMRRVEYCVDATNLRSRAAVAKLGAVQEGILRSHRITQTGRIRDTVYFSILASEWPGVKERLLERLAAF